MNLLTDDFISTTTGKISLKELLTSEIDYQLQYAFDEIQLAMLQLLSSLSTVVLKPSLDELKGYLKQGLTEAQYDQALEKVDLQWFDEACFMRSPIPDGEKVADAPITKMISGVECGTSPNALGLFSEITHAEVICPDCTHVLNYNLHMNIKGECFGPTGATGIRGGGAISTLIAGKDLKITILANTIAVDYFNNEREIKEANNELMWQDPIQGDIYYAHHIGLERGLFALAYHIDFTVIDTPCICDVCGHESTQSVKEFIRLKYKGSYASTKKGRDGNAKWWPHPFTPIIIKEEGVFPVCARDQNWQSWQNFSSYVLAQETDKSLSTPAFIVRQYRKLATGGGNLLIGGNIADQGSITGRVYDLYSMPEHWDNDKLKRVTKVIDTGLNVKDSLSQALNKMFGAGYDKNFVSGIKSTAMNQYISNAQNIVQQLLLDVDRKEAIVLRKEALEQLKTEATTIYRALMRKYQSDLPLFKALAKGERVLMAVNKVKT
ncbi:MAG: type I-E CRISPR-associated protein Cse1/CasA [Thiotrichaceae bacterium]|nr:type I-E CRISPR-associated protein Cse1/CasA [Thiotrichaceae bacterium]